MTDFDLPTLSMTDYAGTNGVKFKEKDLFQDFVRLQIGKNMWYVVSDSLLWKVTMDLEYEDGEWQNVGTTWSQGN